MNESQESSPGGKEFEETADFGESAWEPQPSSAVTEQISPVHLADAHQEGLSPSQGTGVDADAQPGDSTDSEPTPIHAPDTDDQHLDLHRPRATPLVWQLSAAVGALLLLTGLMVYRVVTHRGPAPIEASRSAALDAGREAARLVFSFDYRHLDKDFKAGLSVTTGEFRRQYESTTGKLVQRPALEQKATQVAEVREAGVMSASVDEVVLLVFVNSESKSVAKPVPKVTQARLQMTMQRHAGSWLVSRLALV